MLAVAGYAGLLLLILCSSEEVAGQCQPVYQLECPACSLRLEKVCQISLEERLVEARVLQCRNITSPGCEGGLATRCSVSFHSSCSRMAVHICALRRFRSEEPFRLGKPTA